MDDHREIRFGAELFMQQSLLSGSLDDYQIQNLTKI